MMLAFPDQARYVADEYLLYYCIHDGNTLSEAAIIGRQQDIEGNMVTALPEQCRSIAAVGTDRLLGLKDELEQVRRSELSGRNLAGQAEPSLRERLDLLLSEIKYKLLKTVTRG